MNRLYMESKDIVSSNIEKLMELFPSIVAEDKIDFDALKQELSEVVIDDKKEKYQLTWPGKKESIANANTPTKKTLRPLKEKSVDFENTQNIYIEGDNLDALKILQESYLNKIKCIYIDPPYNTGNDFIYNDNFNKSSNDELVDSGVIDSEGNRMVSNPSSNGRYHSDWLSMMYPRLKLARNLLTNDGLIFISIGEHEVANLKKICDEIFGENNFIEDYVWESTFRPDNSSNTMRRNAEYVMCYAREIKFITRLIGERKSREGMPSLTKASMKESILKFPSDTVKTYLPNGKYCAGIRDSYELLDDVEVNDGIILNEFRLKGKMIWGQEYLLNEISKGTEIYIKGENFVPYTKKAGDAEMSPAKLIPNNIVGDVLSANAEVSKLFEKKPFDYPKPVTLIKYLLSYLEDKNFTVLDFFSGSSTTAHAVMKLNSEDEGKRKFIMVQLPEKVEKDGYSSICEIGEERIRRAGKQIKDETNADIDYGFRVYKVDSSNMKDVYYKPNELGQQDLFDMISNIKEDRTTDDILTQVILDLGLTLDLKIEEKNILSNKVYYVANNSLVACLDDSVDINIVDEICKCDPLRVVFKDSAFKTDKDKINLEERFKKLLPDKANDTNFITIL